MDVINMGCSDAEEKVNDMLHLLKNAYENHSTLQQGAGHQPDEVMEELKEEIYDIIEIIKSSLGYPENMPKKYKNNL